MRALAVELGEKGIAASATAPGFFLTDVNAAFFAQPRAVELARRIPLQRFGRPDELVGAAIFLRRRVLHHGPGADGGRGALGRPVTTGRFVQERPTRLRCVGLRR
jgi:NAD(P)-dependent dehydrogenase (short-subunit alcohol dehydrogenase family)